MAYENIRFTKSNMVIVDGYFFMFDESSDTLVQKLSDGDTVFEYPLSIKLNNKFYEDNFDTNDYDHNLWDLSTNNGTVDFSNGTFRWSTSGGSSSTGLYCNTYDLKGIFDVRSTFNCLIYPHSSYWSIIIYLYNKDTGRQFTTFLRDTGSTRTYKTSYYDGSWHETTINTSDLSGGLRMYRSSVSGYTYGYYWDSGGGWTNSGLSHDHGMISNCNNIRVSLVIHNGGGYPAFSAEQDNFSMFIQLSAVKSVQYDGTYFWTLQEITSTSEVVIRKWLIHNYTCKLVDEFMYENSGSYTYDSDAFGIEHYITNLTNTISGGETVIQLDKYYDTVVDSGTILTLSDNEGYVEDVTVTGIVGTSVYLESPVQYYYPAQSKATMSRSIFMFNNYYGLSSDVGALYRFDSRDGSYMSSDYNTEYQNVIAATYKRFNNILRDTSEPVYQTYSDAYALVYVKDTNVKFRNMTDLINIVDASSVSDDFTGVSGTFPNSTRWEITDGDPRLYDNKLFCSTVIDGYDKIRSNYLLMGDFDVKVSGTSISPSDFDFSTTTVTDDFTGVSGSLPNATLWSIDSSSASGTVFIYDNRLRLTVPESANDESMAIVSNFYLSGDFDIQIDYEEISNDPPSSSYSYPVNFRIYGDTYYSVIGIRLDSLSNTYMMVGGDLTSQVLASTVYTSGKLRITRTGSTIKSYYWSGSQWEWDGDIAGFTYSESFLEDAYVVIRVSADYDSGAVTDYDNFSVEYGHTSYNLLCDAFTGSPGVSGTPDLVKWTYTYPSLSWIYDNKLEMTVNTDNTYCEVGTTYRLKGNFDVQVDYELIDFPDINHCRCNMEVRTVNDGWRYRCHRWYNGADRYAAEQYNGSYWSTLINVSTTDTVGKLRMTRVDEIIKNYYWNGSTWVNFYTWAIASTDQVTIHLAAYVSTNFPTIKIAFDNFSINSVDELTSFYALHGMRIEFPFNNNHLCEISKRYGIDTLGDGLITRYFTEQQYDYYSNSDFISTTVNDYMFRIKRAGSDIAFYYKTMTSGIMDTDWTLFDNITMYSTDCKLSLYLLSQNVTISGSYHDDLVYTEGKIRYPIDTIPYYGVMNIDNVRTDNSTIIPVQAISIYEDNLYRLQDEATYYGTNNDWGSYYNYQISPIRSFIDFITVGIYPQIIPATGRNAATITAIVHDQYGNGVINKPISFTDDDSVGFISSPVVYTDVFFGTGEVTTGYISGTDLRTVTIQGEATQYD